MRYKSFKIENYRAIKHELVIDLEQRIIPLVGINECGKTTVLQAILCFDSSNDKEYESKHLENINNLYETEHNKAAVVSAVIETTPEEIEDIVKHIIHYYEASKAIDKIPELSQYDSSQLGTSKKTHISIEICRDLKDRKYFFHDTFVGLPEKEQHILGNEIVKRLPYILYNDDFNDRPADSIEISEDEQSPKSGWEAIFNRVFQSTNENYSLYSCIKEEDPKLRLSILSDVMSFLNDALTNEWRKFSPKKEKISIKLDVDVATSSLKILIEDTLNGKSRFFSISNRSKGFIWYYNFIMKVRFNPKYTDNIKDTVFLLDEPGSYLHEMAQESLCRKLRDISNKEGVVVYCTHSPKLLMPEVIPLNNIIIVDKSSKGYISATGINDYKTSSKRKTAMQPVFDALMIPEYEMIHQSEKIVCVEGIYDKYAIELFANIPDNCIIFPSVNADSIIKNIQYFLAYNKEYLAIWDNDDEGKMCYSRAKNVYGVFEEKNLMLLPSSETGKRRMEEMFENEDLRNICDKMKLPDSSKYETIISTLYFMKTQQKNDIIRSVSEETINNFKIISEKIHKHFA